MPAGTALHIVRRRDLKAGFTFTGYDDPDQIAVMSPQKARTLLDNPLAGGDDEPVALIGTGGDRVIGRFDLIAGRVEVRGVGPVPVFWGSHLIVDPAHRNTLMGVSLVMKSHQVVPAVGALGPSQLAVPLYQKLKYADHPLPRYIALRRSRAVVEKYLGAGAAAASGSMLLDTALAAHRGAVALWRALRTAGLRAVRAERMPERLDPLFASRPQPVALHRSAAWINWLLTHSFKDDPRNSSSLHLVHGPRDEPVGYFLTKVRFHETATHRGFKNVLLGSVQDWMVFDPGRLTMPQLLLLAVREVIAAGADAVEVSTDDPAARTTLRMLGFARVGGMHMLVRGSPQSPLSRPEFRDPVTWWIRPCDGDTFFV